MAISVLCITMAITQGLERESVHPRAQGPSPQDAKYTELYRKGRQEGAEESPCLLHSGVPMWCLPGDSSISRANLLTV